MTKSIVFGASGQDGSYLVELLLSQGHTVYGVIRRNSNNSHGNLTKWVLDSKEFNLVEGDITDTAFLHDLFTSVMPDYIYNLAAQSHVGTSFRMPMYTLEVTGIGAINIMNAMKIICPNARMYQASSSEMYGDTSLQEFPLHELTPLNPVSPYGVAKVAAHEMAKIFRKEGLFIASGILFNHESPRRGELFLTSKVIKAASKKEKVRLGNLSAIRDWGYAPEYVEGMTRMLEANDPNEFVLATGVGYTVKDFVYKVYEIQGLNPEEYVEYNVPEFMRPVEVDKLIGDSTKANLILGWYPSVDLDELITIMLEEERLKQLTG